MTACKIQLEKVSLNFDGGMKKSGNGREGGVWGIEDFLEVKSVSGWTSE